MSEPLRCKICKDIVGRPPKSMDECVVVKAFCAICLIDSPIERAFKRIEDCIPNDEKVALNEFFGSLKEMAKRLDKLVEKKSLRCSPREEGLIGFLALHMEHIPEFKTDKD